MKRSDIVRSIQVRFKHMRTSDAAAILDTVSDHMIESIANGDSATCLSVHLIRNKSVRLTKDKKVSAYIAESILN